MELFVVLVRRCSFNLRCGAVSCALAAAALVVRREMWVVPTLQFWVGDVVRVEQVRLNDAFDDREI